MHVNGRFQALQSCVRLGVGALQEYDTYTMQLHIKYFNVLFGRRLSCLPFFFKKDEQRSLNTRLLAVSNAAEASDDGGYGGHGRTFETHGVFRTGKKLLHGKLEAGSALSDLRALIYRSIQTYASSAPSIQGEGCSNVFTSLPGTCSVRRELLVEQDHMELEIVRRNVFVLDLILSVCMFVSVCGRVCVHARARVCMYVCVCVCVGV